MDDQTTKMLLKKAKKHKKWTETVFVNPIYWEVNGTPYYMGGFRKNNQSVASAYLTIGEEKLEEALVAQPKLSLFADLSSNILSVGAERTSVEASFYTKPLGIAVLEQEPTVLQGRGAFAQLWEIQQKFKDLVKDYKNYYDDVLVRGRITDEDINKTQETAIMVNMYQYLTLKTLLDQNAEIRTFTNYLERTNGWSDLTKDERTFVKGITENIDKMRKNLEGLGLIVVEDFEEMKKLNYDKMIEENKKIVAGQRQYIRYPK